jgi:hypothetical protein
MKIHLLAGVLLPSLNAEEAKFPPINPALLYWQAAAMLPKLSEEQASEVNEMATGRKPVDAEKLGSYGFGSGSRLLRKAAASPAPCDWGLAFEDGPETVMPHLSKLREMALIATAHAEAKFAEGQTAQGIDWLLTVHRIARHAAVGDTLISFLVQNAIESIAISSAGRHCLGWDEAARRGYVEKLKALPPSRSLAESYHGERVFIDWIERMVQSGDAQNKKRLKAAFDSEVSAGKDAAAQAELLHRLMSLETSQKEIAALRVFSRRIEAAFGKSWKDSTAEIQAIEEEAGRSENLGVRDLLPGVVPVRQKAFMVATLRTMLEAALQHGAGIDEAAVATYQDAFEGKPLRLKKDQDGSLRIVATPPYPKARDIELKLGK